MEQIIRDILALTCNDNQAVWMSRWTNCLNICGRAGEQSFSTISQYVSLNYISRVLFKSYIPLFTFQLIINITLHL